MAQDDTDRADVSNTKDLDAACALFGLTKITSELTTRKMQRGGARGSQYLIDFNKVQAESARDAVTKAIYTKLFDWIVIKVRASQRSWKSTEVVAGFRCLALWLLASPVLTCLVRCCTFYSSTGQRAYLRW